MSLYKDLTDYHTGTLDFGLKLIVNSKPRG